MRNGCRVVGAFGRPFVYMAREARYHAAVGSYGHVDKFIAPSRFMRDAVVGRAPLVAFGPIGRLLGLCSWV